MSKDSEAPIDERVNDLERELKNTQKQITKLSEELMGTITILCLPLTHSRKLELGFKQVEQLPNNILKVIIRRYIMESKHSDLSFDTMITPVVSVLGFERAWKVITRTTINEVYGEWSLGKWDEMAK
ncbi:MAG: hypothetical protein CO032_08080, partial [Nitrosopumilales archaeon CG_4_9_14_0_2_um_filter_34_16]